MISDLTAGLVIGVVIGGCLLVIKLIDYFLQKHINNDNTKETRCWMDDARREEIISAAKKINQIDFRQIEDEVHHMDVLHSKTDENGVPVWYVKSSLETAIIGLNTSINNQNDLIKEQIIIFKQMVGEMKEVKTKVNSK